MSNQATMLPGQNGTRSFSGSTATNWSGSANVADQDWVPV